MKTLSTEQQVELQKLLENLTDSTFEPNYEELAYWATELKPKRVRKKLSPKEEAGFSPEHII